MESLALDRRVLPPGAVLSQWKAPDGRSLRRLDWGRGAGAPSRGSLLFANGRGDFIEKYIEALAYWYQRGWNVTSFDWRGQGGSRAAVGSPLPGHLSSFDPLVGDLACLLGEWMSASHAPHVAIGHSMGGHLLLRAIAEHRPPLKAAVLVAPMIGINGAPIPPAVGALVARMMVRLGRAETRAWKRNERPALLGSSRQAYLTSCPDRYSDELWWRQRHPEFDLGAPSWGWLDAAYRSSATLDSGTLQGVDLPVLLLGTERDRLVSPGEIKRAAHALPRAEIHMYPDAAHEILRESDAVRIDALQRIDAFLDRHAPR